MKTKTRQKPTREESLDAIRTYLSVISEVGGDQPIGQYNRLILEKGEEFYGVQPVKAVQSAKDWKKYFRPKAKQCFYNAQMFADNCPDAKYYEGYCYAELIPYHHAWNVLDGQVLDFTFEAANAIMKRKGFYKDRTPAYVGVYVPTPEILKNIVATGTAEPLAQKFYLGKDWRFI